MSAPASSEVEALRRRVEKLEERVAELEDALGMSVAVPPAFTAEGVKPFSRRKVWRLICGFARRGKLNREQALIVLYSDRDVDARPEAKIVDVFLAQARRWLALHGIAIITSWGCGWGMSAQDRGKLQQLITRYEAPPS